MTKKSPVKVLSTGALVTIFTASALIPVATVSAETTHDLDQVVVEKEGQTYSFSLSVYRAALLKGYLKTTDVGYIHSTNGDFYKLSTYRAALIKYGNKEEALDFLDGSAHSIEITPVEGEFDKNGEIIPPIVGEFEVTDISAVTKSSITVNGNAAPPSSTPTAKQFNVTVGGIKVDVAKVIEQNDGSFLLEVDLTGQQGKLVVNEVSYDDHIVDYLTKLSVYVENNHVLTITNGLSTSLSEVKEIYAEIFDLALKFIGEQGLSVDGSFISDVETAVKNEITDLTGETVMSNVRLADLDGKTISITLTGYEEENPDSVKTYDFEISFQSHLD